MTETAIDARDFPEAAAYVAQLEHGLASHPQCEVKGSVVREVAAGFDASVAARLPDELRSLIVHPPPVSVWVSEVPVNALILVQAELLAKRTGRPSAMIERAFDASRALLSTPLYKILFLVVSPERLVAGVEKRWSALRRGTRIEVIERGPRDARIRAHYPADHYNQTLLAIRAASIRAALVCAGASSAHVELERRDARSSDFVCSWG